MLVYHCIALPLGRYFKTYWETSLTGNDQSNTPVTPLAWGGQHISMLRLNSILVFAKSHTPTDSLATIFMAAGTSSTVINGFVQQSKIGLGC